MSFGELMRQTLARKDGLLGLALSIGGMAAVFGMAGAVNAAVVPKFIIFVAAFVSMAGTRLLTATMNKVRAEDAERRKKKKRK